MSTPPPIIFAWDGAAMVPHQRFSQLAEQSFTAGHAYRMIVQGEKEDPRSVEQNKKMWAMLAECASQLKLHGRSYDKERWKAIMLHAWGQEVEFLPTLDGSTFFPHGQQTSKLGKREMGSFIEFIIAEGTKRGVVFHDGLEEAA